MKTKKTTPSRSVQRRVRALPEMVPWCDDIDVDDYVPYPRAAKRLNAKRTP